jgi:hypothetical protein
MGVELPRLYANKAKSYSRFAPPLTLIFAVAVYAVLSFPLREWLVDDAGISMAYAANWVSGHGLVSQPGFPPVEGYSNFLWVILLAGLNLIAAMTLPGVKGLAFILTGLSLVSLNATCKAVMSDFSRAVVLMLTATSTPLVVWTNSGLENPLTLLITCEMLRTALHPRNDRSAIYLGALVGCLGMTRPEGIVFLAFPLLTLWRQPRDLFLSALTTLFLYGSFLTFRWFTFGDLVPNTYYAKDASALSPIAMLANAMELAPSALGFSLVLCGVVLASYGRPKTYAPFIMVVLSAAVYILMPRDWMPERRFATAFFPAIYLLAGLALNRSRLILSFVTLISITSSCIHLRSFYARPALPLAEIKRNSDLFNIRAQGIPNASILLPDLGAFLLSSELRVYDLAGLTDRVIAHSLHSDKKRLHDYVFDEIRPTFIKTNGEWAEYASLDQDPRFRRDYVPIHEGLDPALLKKGVKVRSGEYVRRDALVARR